MSEYITKVNSNNLNSQQVLKEETATMKNGIARLNKELYMASIVRIREEQKHLICGCTEMIRYSADMLKKEEDAWIKLSNKGVFDT